MIEFSDIYRTNMFHLTSTGCALVLQKDLEYWGIDELMMEPCCALKYYPEIETCVNEKTGDLKEREREKELAEEENFGDHTVAQIRSWLWNVMEYPWTSKTGMITEIPHRAGGEREALTICCFSQNTQGCSTSKLK